MVHYKHLLAVSVFALLGACGGGGGGSAPVTASAAPVPVSVSKVTISGKITFDHVPHNASQPGLDFNNISKFPARRVPVELLDGAGTVLQSGITDAQGGYQFTVNPNTDVQIRAKARVSSSSGARWDFMVSDNTRTNTLYALTGSLASSGINASQVRDLNASSGWGGASYNGTRAAAPFAILSSLYDAALTLESADPDINLPRLEIRWSKNNLPLFGNFASGQIGSSAYHKDIDGGVIYLLGHAANDTDEFDPHVITHEFGHFLEDKLARSDSVGGAHDLGDKLDARVAFSEGWANAFSAITSGASVYRDSMAAGQNAGFSFDLENNDVANPGWFNEGTVGALIYDIYDSSSDGNDVITAGFAPLLDALAHPEHKTADVFTTVYSYAAALKAGAGLAPSDLDDFLASQSITGQGQTGEGEQNSGEILTTLPVFKTLTLDGPAAQICSVDDAGSYNKLGNREFLTLNIAADGNYQINMQTSDAGLDRDPDFVIWKQGQEMYTADTAGQNAEVFTGELSQGRYVLEAYDHENVMGSTADSGDTCFNVVLTRS